MNPPTVLKFGGSSFATADDYRSVAEHILERRARHDGVVAVVSAQPGETESFRKRLLEFGDFEDRTAAGLLTLPDMTSAYLLAAAVHQVGGTARVLPQHHSGVLTDDRWMWARIQHFDPEPVRTALPDHDVVIIGGGPAATEDGHPTWMGKNSSDLAAVAAAINIGAPGCEIYSDVEGVYTADPRFIPEATLIPELDFITARRVAMRGAKVLHSRAIELAARHDLTITCRLNKAPYATGTRLRTGVSDAVAVVVDLQSQLIRCSDRASADQVHADLSSRGLQTVSPEDLDEPIVAVTGGYADLAGVMDQTAAAEQIPGRLISVIDANDVRSYIAADDTTAVSLGVQLHRGLTAATI